MRRFVMVMAIVAIVSTTQADALTVRDVIELSKAGVSDQVLLALIEVDHRVYTIDTDAVKRMQEAGVSDAVMLAMIHAGRSVDAAVSAMDTMPQEQAPQQSMNPEASPFQQNAPPPEIREVPVPVPVAVPVAVPIVAFDGRGERVTTTLITDTGAAVRARIPIPWNCTKAEPVYWGNGGKRRPGTWEPPPQVICQ